MLQAQWKPLNVLKFTKGYKVKIIGCCYHSVSTIIFSLTQRDYIIGGFYWLGENKSELNKLM